MALRYEFAWDVASLEIIGSESASGLGVRVTEDPGGAARQSQISFTSGTYCHTDLSSVTGAGTFDDFAGALKTALDDDATLTGTYTVSWSGTTGYTITNNQAAVLDLEFSAATTTEHGTNLRRLLGFESDQTGAAGTTGYTTNMRPDFLIIPAVQGRTQLTDEVEPDGIAQEAIADDGSPNFIAKDTAEIWVDWVQVGEIETTPTTGFGEGTVPFKRQGDNAATIHDVRWTYQHAFEHIRRGDHPFLVVDGTESAVFRMRADGMSFRPTRWTGTDQPIWSVPFRARLQGRL